MSDLILHSSALRLDEHPGIWVEADDTLEEVGEKQRDAPWPAADVEQAPAAIQLKVFSEGLRQRGRIGISTLPVVVGGALEHGGVPHPAFPRMLHMLLCHRFSLACDDPITPVQGPHR